MVEICLIGHFSCVTTGLHRISPGPPCDTESDELATLLAAKSRECQLSHRLDDTAIAVLH